MPPTLTSTPTNVEAQALSALVPVPPAPPDPLDDWDALDNLLSFCRTPFIRDFLFSKDALHVPHLRHPDFRKTAISGRMTVTRVEPTDNPDTALSDQFDGRYLFLPAFSLGATSLGFFVYEALHRRAKDWDLSRKGTLLRAVGRFIRDDARGILVMVFEAPEVNWVRIEHLQLLTPTRQKRTAAMFSREKFLAMTAENCFDTDHLLPTLIELQSSLESRSCPLCSASADVCLCQLTSTHPRHPFDVQAFMQNMSIRQGTFEGLANLFVYDNENNCRVATLGTRISHHREVDVTVMENLRSWALHEFGEQVNPRQGVLSTKPMKPMPRENLRYAIVDEMISNPFPNDVDKCRDVRVEWHGVPRELDIPNFQEGDDGDGTAPGSVPGSVPSGTTRNSRKEGGGPSSSQGSPAVIRDMSVAERILKRKENNRASARKSNMMRKFKTIRLKRELEVWRERAEVLLARDMSLRRENVRLKKLCAQALRRG